MLNIFPLNCSDRFFLVELSFVPELPVLLKRFNHREMVSCFLFRQFCGIVFLAIVMAGSRGVVICFGDVSSMPRSPSMQSDGDRRMLHPKNSDRLVVISFRKCCTGGHLC